MVRHTQTIRQLLPTNCLSMFNHFVGLSLKELISSRKSILLLFDMACIKGICTEQRLSEIFTTVDCDSELVMMSILNIVTGILHLFFRNRFFRNHLKIQTNFSYCKASIRTS